MSIGDMNDNVKQFEKKSWDSIEILKYSNMHAYCKIGCICFAYPDYSDVIPIGGR